MKKNFVYTCDDLELSAFLWTRGVRFLGIEGAPTLANRRHMVFKFHDPDGACDIEADAYVNGAEISAREFAHSLRQLKDHLVFLLKKDPR